MKKRIAKGRRKGIGKKRARGLGNILKKVGRFAVNNIGTIAPLALAALGRKKKSKIVYRGGAIFGSPLP